MQQIAHVLAISEHFRSPASETWRPGTIVTVAVVFPSPQWESSFWNEVEQLGQQARSELSVSSVGGPPLKLVAPVLSATLHVISVSTKGSLP
jgi:hypothetical protein